MAGRRRKDSKVTESEGTLRGNRLLKPIKHLIEGLHTVGAERDRAGNRKLFCDQYVTLVLLYFFTPSLDSLRALQEATGWEKTRKTLGIKRTSLGALSEAADLFDAAQLEPIIEELAARALPLSAGREAEALKGLTAVDGLVFAGLSRMAWALWNGPESRFVKLPRPFRRPQSRPLPGGGDPGGLLRTWPVGGDAPPRSALRGRSSWLCGL